MIVRVKNSHWYRETATAPFFGDFYYRGDHSLEGYLPNRPLTVAQRTVREVEGVARLLDLTPTSGARILDAPCGYGRHLLEMRALGYDVSGIDLCSSYCASVNAALVAKGLPAAVKQAELNKLPWSDESFDVVMNLFFSFGFYPHDKTNQHVLAEFYRILRPGGRFIFHTDVNVPLIGNGKYSQPSPRRLEGGGRLFVHEKLNNTRQRLIGSWTIEQEGYRTKTVGYDMRIYTFPELEACCRRARFSSVQVFGSFDIADETYSDDSQEMIVIAYKD